MGSHRRPRRQRTGDLATTAAIVLAAGESTRMGRLKQLLPWHGVPLIEYQVSQLREAGVDEIAVVLGHAVDEIRLRVPGQAIIVENEEHVNGRATSLRAGAQALPDHADPILVVDVDRPRPSTLLRALLDEHRNHNALISRPVFGGRHGHPIVVSGALLGELRNAADESQGLLGVVNAHRADMQDIDLGDEQVLIEFNTPEEYEEARAKFGYS